MMICSIFSNSYFFELEINKSLNYDFLINLLDGLEII